MECKFRRRLTNNQGVACKTSHALNTLKSSLDDAFTIKELRDDLCKGTPVAREQCTAHEDLAAHGKNSQFAK